jgi:2-succinyl-5-enolpyruvyl-6-hydroxy-3-cyclohexene-1-carboxylate synthase
VTLQESVPSPSAVQASFAATLADEWHRNGLRDVVVSPGSRSTPLVLAVARHGGFVTHVRLDERSAAFFALGRALVTRRPVAVVVTSGTAAAEVHAAVAEADAAGVALLVLTADRPPELHHVGAPQTMDQRHLYGTQVRSYEEPGVARWESRATWRALASRAYASAVGVAGRPGPVHVNLAFIEPLVAVAAPLAPSRTEGPWRVLAPRDVVRTRLDVPAGTRVLCVVGAGVEPAVIDDARERDWVVLGDATARRTLAHFDAVLRGNDVAAALRPDVIVRLGGLPASKVLAERMLSWDTSCVAYDGAGPVADPTGIVGTTLAGLPASDSPRGDATYLAQWQRASQSAEEWLVSTIDADLNEPSVARALVRASTRHDVNLVVGSSMPVRDVEWWAASREAPTFANRGVNGIDGVTSTILGVASGGRALGLVGDLTLLHDVSALVEGLGEGGGSAVIVVADNGGGGIFSFLSQVEEAPDVFARYFATSRPIDLVAMVTSFGHHAAAVSTVVDLDMAIDDGLAREGLSVVVASVPSRERNVALHDEMNVAVSALVDA